jgi:tetratricopeptide (TPR) repeat protein
MSVRTREWGIQLLIVASIALVATGVHRANLSLESHAGSSEASGDIGALPNGKVVRVASLGFERLVADLFWLRTVYYLGDEASHEAGYPAAARLAELVTDVDPYFHTAYVLMNSVLTALRAEPEAAIGLLDKGIEHLPESWRLYFLQGFNHFMYEHDYARAAGLMRRAAERGGPDYLPLLATRLYNEAGDPETAIAFVRARLEQAETPLVRESLEGRLRDLLIVRDLGRIEAAIARYRELHGPALATIVDLVRTGLLPGIPLDPEGHPYEIRDGAAYSVLHYDPLELHLGGEG